MAASSKTVPAHDTISPKVFWPMAVALVLTFLAASLAAVTPEMLGALGPFAVPMAMGLTALATTIAGYLKSDSLRAIGVEAAAAVLPQDPAPVPEHVAVEPVEGFDEDLSDRFERSTGSDPAAKGLVEYTPEESARYAAGDSVEV